MESLTDEILAKIFSYLPLAKSKIASGAVCKTWARTLLRADSHLEPVEELRKVKPLEKQIEDAVACLVYGQVSLDWLKVLPNALDDRRYAAGGHENIQDILRAPTSEDLLPAVLTYVKHMSLTTWSCFSDDLSLLTRTRFPRLETLTINVDYICDDPIDLTSLTTLQGVHIECRDNIPEVELPTESKLHIVTVEFDCLPSSVASRVDTLAWELWSDSEATLSLDLSLLEACTRLKQIALNIRDMRCQLVVVDNSVLGPSVREIYCSVQGRHVKVAFVCCADWISKPEGEKCYVARRLV